MMLTAKIAEKLKNELRSRGLRVATPRIMGACIEVIGEYRGKSFAVYVYPGRFTETLVAKLVPAICGCERALSCPYGLLAIAEEDALAEAIYSKIERLLAIAKYVEEERIELY